MKERVYNTVWGLGLRVRNTAKRAGVLGPLDGIMWSIGLRLLPPPARETGVTLPWEVQMILPPKAPSARTFAAGLYEKDVTALVRRLLAQDMTFVDIGANVGYYTLLASRLVASSGTVYSFEPHPYAHQILNRNIVINNCSNVVAAQQAVSDTAGVATLVSDGEGERSYIQPSHHTPGRDVVETTTLDSFFAEQGWPEISLIKMDIEGGEMAALAGMVELSQRNPSMKLIMEFNPQATRRAGSSWEALASALQGLGFRRANIIERGLTPLALDAPFPHQHALHNLLLQKG